MSLRAIWKGIIGFGAVEVPVKFYSALEDQTVHFRLLHRKDKQPVHQKMINEETGKEVQRENIRKGVDLGSGRVVLLDEDELQKLEPEGSRSIPIKHFTPFEALGHQWYDRPYYLGPDGEDAAYWNLHSALEKTRREGIARWTMRGKEYVGALRAEPRCLVMITLRFAEQVISPSAVEPPEFREFEKPEINMARQLVGMMTGNFEPQHFHDEYRSRILQLIETKKRGGKVKIRKPAPKKESDSLADALKASLAGMED